MTNPTDPATVLAKWDSMEQVVISLQHAVADSEEGNEALRIAFVETRAALAAAGATEADERHILAVAKRCAHAVQA